MATFGGPLGLFLGRWGRDLILGAVPIEMPRWMDSSFDLQRLREVVSVLSKAGR